MIGQAHVPAEPNVEIVFDNMVSQWGMVRYAQLSVLIVYMRHLSLVHQANHWVSKGDSFYGDHLLFQRLYDDLVKEIDALAEKAVGLGSSDNVNIPLHAAQVAALSQELTQASTIPNPNQLCKRSLAVEKNFLEVLNIAAAQLKEQALMTRGLSNMLDGIHDMHEGHVYLLKMRCE